MLVSDVLLAPVQTEKTVQQLVGKYVFYVHSGATKGDIKNAIKEFYGKDVEKVNIVKNPAKTRLIGRGTVAQKRAEKKKAIITLQEGQTLDFNAFK
ncbi:50S ribosomal protein L23 [bacterium DOLZORAL124_38_8]|nr:MAG: 50S ribosomal protein L23 [bacterium DOLZORAL124_38_8]